eukprot:746838-Hanusia_phi.AAC.3
MSRRMIRELRREISRYDDDTDDYQPPRSSPDMTQTLSRQRSPRSDGARSITASRNHFKQQHVAVPALNFEEMKNVHTPPGMRGGPTGASVSPPRAATPSLHARRLNLTPREHVVKAILNEDSDEEVRRPGLLMSPADRLARAPPTSQTSSSLALVLSPGDQVLGRVQLLPQRVDTLPGKTWQQQLHAASPPQHSSPVSRSPRRQENIVHVHKRCVETDHTKNATSSEQEHLSSATSSVRNEIVCNMQDFVESGGAMTALDVDSLDLDHQKKRT